MNPHRKHRDDPEWWEMLDWDSMGIEAFNRLRPDIKEKIREAGMAPVEDKQ